MHVKLRHFLQLILFSQFNSYAGSLPTIEPSDTDLSKPIAAACVETTPNQVGLTAWDKLKTIMTARGQMIAASGDQIIRGNKYQEMIFTISNNFSGKEGYIIDSPLPKGQKEQADGFCFEPVSHAVFEDVSKLNKVPDVLNKGELGIALTNNHNLGSKIAVMGRKPNGSLFVVHFNPNERDQSGRLTGRGALKGSDAQGENAKNMAFFVNFDYSDKMKMVLNSIK